VVSESGSLARLGYGALFVGVLPAGLALVAHGADPNVPLPPVRSMPAGLGALGLGLVLLAAGARELITRGRGLPMNAFPPPRLVRSGIYHWVRNPMYLGFGLGCAGAAVATGSPAGLWLVTPVAWLGALALVFGFERNDLAHRFGEEALRPPLLSLPRGGDEPPTAPQRAAVVLWVLLPWLGTWLAVQALGRPPDAFGTALPFEGAWPVFPSAELFYASAYLFIPLTVFVIHTQGDLRRFSLRALIAIPVVTLIWLTVPAVATNRPFAAENSLARLLALEQRHSQGVAAFPAFHVLWALLAADGWAANSRSTGRTWWSWVGWAWAALITASCLATAMHTVVETGAAILMFPLIRSYPVVWEALRRVTERLANSWREWRVGPVRVINHALWAAAAGGVGTLVAGSAAGRGHVAAVAWIGVCMLVGSALLAQLLEGSARLLRPFGWYGGVLGGIFGTLTANAAGAPLLPILAALAVAAPWTQMLGRIRCLVQGCCHGHPAAEGVGIRYHHPRTRVAQLAGLAGVPVHATPLYSVATNLVLGVVLLRLRILGTPDSVLVGLYLALAGIARFVEESYRGEPQTPIVAGLRSYQWLAVASVILGLACTTIRASQAMVAFARPGGPLLLASLGIAVLAGAMMGVDFPDSNLRYSRLASGAELPSPGVPAAASRSQNQKPDQAPVS
jgi:protein-S-isoprenylcysteine O-methyltransferase Ste14